MAQSQKSTWTPGRGQLPSCQLKHPSGAQAEIYAHGAHLTSWKSARAKDWIFTSEQAKFDGVAAIRGGVPIIFPQFNAFGDGPRHGFARNLTWQCQKQDESELTMVLTPSEATQIWPHQFRAEFKCMIDSDSLAMALTVRNDSEEAFNFTCALHSYFQIESLATTRLEGLEGASYWDNDGSPFSQRSVFDQSELRFEDALDRVFFNCHEPLTLHDGADKLVLTHIGFKDVVVWNPGKAAAQDMADFGNEEFENMLCVEAAQIDQPIELAPGEQWRGQQICRELP